MIPGLLCQQRTGGERFGRAAIAKAGDELSAAHNAQERIGVLRLGVGLAAEDRIDLVAVGRCWVDPRGLGELPDGEPQAGIWPDAHVVIAAIQRHGLPAHLSRRPLHGVVEGAGMQRPIVTLPGCIRQRGPVIEISIVEGERQDRACAVVERMHLGGGQRAVEHLKVAHPACEGPVVSVLLRLAVRPQPDSRAGTDEAQIGLAEAVARRLPVDVARQQPISVADHHQVMPDVRRKQPAVAQQRRLASIQLRLQRDVVRGVGLEREVVVALS